MDLDELVGTMPFAAGLGMRLSAAGPERATGTFAWREDLCTIGGLLHGGALMAFADSLGAVCAYLNLPPGAGTATLSSATHLFRGVRGGTVHGTAVPLHVGRSTIVVQTDLRDDADRAVARVTQTQSVLAAT